MRILVAGGAGFIGSHVVDAFLNLGHQVIVVDDLSTGSLENLNAQASLYQLDINDQALEQVFLQERPDIVCHHAAQVNVRRSIAQPALDARVNVLGSINLLECAVRYGVQRFIYSSSGGAIYGEPDQLPCSEGAPISPISPYGVSKYAVEKYLEAYAATHDLHPITLRYGNVYGPRQDPHGEAGVVSIFVSQMIAGRRPTIYGDGRQTRDFVYVADCVAANVAALTTESQGAFNVASGAGTSVNTIFRLLSGLTGFGQEPIYDPAIPGETRHIYLDINRARRDLAWQPGYSLEEGLAQTVDHFRR